MIFLAGIFVDLGLPILFLEMVLSDDFLVESDFVIFIILKKQIYEYYKRKLS